MSRERREERRRDAQNWSRRPRLGPRQARALFDAATDYRVRRWRFFEDALEPAMPLWSGFAAEYAHYRRFASAPPLRPGTSDPWHDLWTFYALSRLFEWLVSGFQGRVGLRLPADWPGPGARLNPPHAGPTRDELLRFFGALGMTPMQVHPRFHPFYYEVAAAERDPALGDAVVVEEEIWPGLWFGDLVFARAGVRVRCGPDAAFDPIVAARSTLYFAWARVHRPTYDLSHGWGSSSQWATEFRRDYIDGAVFRYNVDGQVRLADGVPAEPAERHREHDNQASLPPARRTELLTHRCFVSAAEPARDLWPFEDTGTEPVPGPDLIW